MVNYELDSVESFYSEMFFLIFKVVCIWAMMSGLIH